MWYLSSQNRALRDQEVADLVAAVIENQRAPVGMLAAARIVVLVQRGAVEAAQAVAVAREVGGHPVDDHADAVLVAVIDEVHEILRRAVAAGGGVVADGLIAPTAGERMLADRQQLDVRVAHLLAVVDQLMGQLAIGQPARADRRRAAANCPGALRRTTSACRALGVRGGWPSTLRRASGSGRGRRLSRRCAAALRRRSRTDRTSRSPRRAGCFTRNLYSVPSPRPGTNNSQMPLGMCFRIGCRRPSQALKSPMTLTPWAFGAQTAKFTPSTPSIVRRMGAQLVVALPMLAFARAGADRNRSEAAERRRDRASLIVRRVGRRTRSKYS